MNILKKWWFSRKPLVSRRVGFSYASQEVLRDITMNVRKKEVVAIIGQSGSGKSTFLKIVAGIIASSHRGKIKVYGKPKFFSKSSIGFVPQELAFIPDLSIEDNIKVIGLNEGIGEQESLQRAYVLMDMLKLGESVKKFPWQLSGGQKVRLNIVLSLLHDPKIVILDEPFVGLDFANRRLLWHFVHSLKKKGKSVILTSHLLSETQEQVDRLIILKGGKVFFSGQMERLMSKLKMNYVYELRFTHLSKAKVDKVLSYCDSKDIQVLDAFGRYVMFGLNTTREKAYLTKFFDKVKLDYKEVSFREPSLDEIFLKA